MNNVGDFGPQLIQLFKEEALDLLAQWENACLALQSRQDTDAWDQLFASVHSLKRVNSNPRFTHFCRIFSRNRRLYVERLGLSWYQTSISLHFSPHRLFQRCGLPRLKRLMKNDICSEIKSIRSILFNTVYCRFKEKTYSDRSKDSKKGIPI